MENKDRTEENKGRAEKHFAKEKRDGRQTGESGLKDGLHIEKSAEFRRETKKKKAMGKKCKTRGNCVVKCLTRTGEASMILAMS